MLLAVTGFVCGAVVGLINTAFVPNCGEDCSAERLGNGIRWGLALLIAFPTIGAFTYKQIGRGLKQRICIVALLSLASIVPAAAFYGYGLHQRYWQIAWQSEIPNLDFSTMAIATRPVKVTLYDTKSKIQVKAWERCALGYAACDELPHTVEAICLGSGRVVLIDEPDWPAFQRIHDEDLKGLEGEALEGAPKDMRLCAASLQ
jgi:hypothetical protein